MRLKRALRRLHARQPWMPKPASGADAAARVAPAWAWRLGPSGGCGKRGRGAGRRGAFRDLGMPNDGPPALPLLPGYAAWFEAGLSPRRLAALRRRRAARRRRIRCGDRRPGSADASSPDPAAKKKRKTSSITIFVMQLFRPKISSIYTDCQNSRDAKPISSAVS